MERLTFLPEEQTETTKRTTKVVDVVFFNEDHKLPAAAERIAGYLAQGGTFGLLKERTRGGGYRNGDYVEASPTTISEIDSIMGRALEGETAFYEPPLLGIAEEVIVELKEKGAAGIKVTQPREMPLADFNK